MENEEKTISEAASENRKGRGRPTVFQRDNMDDYFSICPSISITIKEMLNDKGEHKMTIQFIQYPKCTTCKKAQKWLDDNGVPYENTHIVEQTAVLQQM